MIEAEQYLQAGDIELRAEDIKTLLEEHNNMKQEIERIKEQLNNEIDDELKQSEIMVKKQNEIERQKEIIKQLDIKNLELTTIIKEVREYIKEMPNNEYIGYWKKEIFEILDKEKKQ